MEGSPASLSYEGRGEHLVNLHIALLELHKKDLLYKL